MIPDAQLELPTQIGKNNNNVDQCGNGKGDSIAVHNKKIFTTGHLFCKGL